MNTIAAQEIKRRGLAAVDSMISHGPVLVIKHNRPAYVIMREQQYYQCLGEADAAYEQRVSESLADLRAGRVRTFATAQTLMKAIKKRRSAR